MWKVTVGDQPSGAVVASDAVILSSRGHVEARRLGTGEKIWSRGVDWAAVAGSNSAVVIAGRTGKGHGYDAVDPDTGRNLWKDDDAIGVWTFTDLVVGIAQVPNQHVSIQLPLRPNGTARLDFFAGCLKAAEINRIEARYK